MSNGRVQFNNGDVKGIMYGGSFIQKPDDLVGVNMTMNVSKRRGKTVIHIPTPDFKLPPVDKLKQGMADAVMAMKRGQDIYVGCGAGIGRTGTFLGLMHRLAVEHYCCLYGGFGVHIEDYDPVEYIRKVYLDTAIETPEQEELVRTLDLTDLLCFTKYLTR